MDLALELGYQTVEALRVDMTEREFGRWRRYAARRMLPSQRVELQLANIARMSAGGGDIEKFVVDPRLRDRITPKPVKTPEEGATAIAAMVGGAGVVRLGQVKRAKRE
jgi:hypothetical protein